MSQRISCLAVSRDRVEMLKRSISFYLNQTWPEKELVIVSNGPVEVQRSIAAHVAELGRPDIRCVFLQSEETLGHLRNLSIDAASGDVLCQWDDDDLYHPRRLETQLRHMNENGAEVSFFYDQLHYFADSGELYWTDWSAQRSQWPDHGAAMSIMWKRPVNVRYPADGEYANRGEDAIVQIELHQRCKVAGVRGAGFLYTYVYHGANTYDRDHHRFIIERMSLGSDFLEAHRAELARHLSEYFPFPLTAISSRDGRKIELP
jgi:glycosyltransferase involved in cell wall biosynthesis